MKAIIIATVLLMSVLACAMYDLEKLYEKYQAKSLQLWQQCVKGCKTDTDCSQRAAKCINVIEKAIKEVKK